MKAVLFTHPDFSGSTSMPLFARSIADGLRQRGVDVIALSPKPLLYRLPLPNKLRKWLGYFDQFIIFPFTAQFACRNLSKDTIYIFADQALGPWIPKFSGRPHAIHCHDLLALRSAIGEIRQNPVSLSGRIYQKWIRRGFNHGNNFICVSHRTKVELERFLNQPELSTIQVVHNGLNYPFSPMPQDTSLHLLANAGVHGMDSGFVLHVGGNQWYKHRAGVIAIYAHYALRARNPLPLLMVGAKPDTLVREQLKRIPPAGRVEFLVRPSTDVLHAAYSQAAALIYPSLAEGFGWPIIEAMACGCPVLTTNDSPMTEAGGSVANYLPVLQGDLNEWAATCAEILSSVLSRSSIERALARDAGLLHAKRFNEDITIESYMEIYRAILKDFVA